MENQDIEIFCVFTNNRKKLDKYVKVNKIKNKIIIDVQKLISSEKFDMNDPIQAKYMKILILKKINMAKAKGKKVYYIPHLKSDRFNMESLKTLKKLVGDNGKLGLIFFWKDFVNDKNGLKKKVIENIDIFTIVQMFEDY